MDSHATQAPSGSSAAATTACHPARTMLLAPYGGGMDQACNVTGDSETIAAGRTSSGHHISVSLRREPSPALSRICVRFQHGTARRPAAYSTVVAAAAHGGGSVLLRIVSKECYDKSSTISDYFVYNAGAAAADSDDDEHVRPPSLYLLPPHFAPAKPWECRSRAHKAAELLLFRDGEWRLMRPRIVHDHGEDRGMYGLGLGRWLWKPQAVVPLGDDNGDGILCCWVDFSHGVIFSDVLACSPVLRYAPFPMAAMKKQHRRLLCTDARGEVKLVTVSVSLPPRARGCSDDLATAVVIDTWSLKTDDMAWVLEMNTTMVDSTELWALANTPGMARFHLVADHVASMDGGGHVVSDENAAPPTEELGDHRAEATRP